MRKLLKILFTLVFVFLIQTIHAQLRFNQISGEEGLSQNTIRSIIQDQNGFIWVGTYDGINKYDGYTMEHYKFSNEANGISSNIIISLFEDKDGNIWAGTTDAGLNRIDKKTGKITIYFNDPHATNYSGEITSIFQNSSGIMFINHNGGIKAFKVAEDGTLIAEKVINEVNGLRLETKLIFPSRDGHHWFFTPNKEIKLSKVEITENNDSINLINYKSDIDGFQLIN